MIWVPWEDYSWICIEVDNHKIGISGMIGELIVSSICMIYYVILLLIYLIGVTTRSYEYIIVIFIDTELVLSLLNRAFSVTYWKNSTRSLLIRSVKVSQLQATMDFSIILVQLFSDLDFYIFNYLISEVAPPYVRVLV